jgi:hypothetical protein
MTAFISKYLLIVAAIASVGISEIQPAQAQTLPDISLPQWLQPYNPHSASFYGH